MEETTPTADGELAFKIKRLVQERGWNQEDFARIADLNRHTVRQILLEGGARRLRNATVSAIAKALGLSVGDLRTLPLDRLLPRMNQQAQEIASQSDTLRRLYDKAQQPDLIAWLERNSERARKLNAEEVDELLALQGPEGPLAAFGVESFVSRLERRRQLVQRVHAIAATEYLDLLENLVELLYEKVQPNRDRS
jgi:transcriptional regulator with XRE-family HTH domain